MAHGTECQTPGAQFHTHISGATVEIRVDLPHELGLSEDDAKLLESNLHNAVELVLARYFHHQPAAP